MSPAGLEIERKWLLGEAPDLSALAPTTVSQITQWYLEPGVDGSERRVRLRVTDGRDHWYYTEKLPTADPTVRAETERAVDPSEGLRLADEALWGPLRKTRYVVSHAGRDFELDHIWALDAWVLEVELDDAGEVVELPELDVASEVTADPRWRNRAIAQMVSGGAVGDRRHIDRGS